jgi:hypothetical protein
MSSGSRVAGFAFAGAKSMGKRIIGNGLLGLGLVLGLAGRAQASLIFPDNVFNDPINGSGGLVVMGSETASSNIGTANSLYAGQLISDAFGGAQGTPEPGRYLFADTADATPDTVSFSTSSDVTISGIYLTTKSDDLSATGNRGASEAIFSYFNGTSYVPVADVVNIANNDSPQLISFPNGPVTASSFELSLAPNSNPPFGYSGVRLVDIAAVSVPEPASLGLLALGSLALLARRRP